jgi:hypothetical protein
MKSVREANRNCTNLARCGGPNQVPPVPLNVQKDRHLPVRLDARGGNKPYARSDHSRVHHFEIINPKEETDPSAKLFANDRRLTLAIGARKQNTGATTGGTNNDPAFRATVVRERRSVLHELELQSVYKKIDRRLVLPHDQGDELEM